MRAGGLLSALALAVVLAATPAATQPAKVTLLQGFNSMSFTPIYVARAKGFFQAEGVDVDVQIVTGSSIAFKGAVAGQAEFAAMGATELITAADRGLDRMIAVAAVNRAVTVSVAVRADVAAARKLDAGAPIAQRIAALRSLTLASGSPGGAIHTVVMYMLRQGGLDPKTDVTVLSMGGTAPMLAALRARQIDAIAISPPAPETAAAEGLGVLLISLSRGDMPELGTIAYDALVTSREYAEKNPDTVRRVVRAIARASNVVLDDPAETRAIMQRAFDKTDPAVMAAVIDNIRGAFARDARFTEDMWRNAVRLNVDAGKIARPLDTREGGLWTNAYNTGR
jgi:NitT/TauT family transport system substrate-binding protein